MKISVFCLFGYDLIWSDEDMCYLSLLFFLELFFILVK